MVALRASVDMCFSYFIRSFSTVVSTQENCFHKAEHASSWRPHATSNVINSISVGGVATMACHLHGVHWQEVAGYLRTQRSLRMTHFSPETTSLPSCWTREDVSDFIARMPRRTGQTQQGGHVLFTYQ